MEQELTRINRQLTAILVLLALGVGLQIWQWAGGGGRRQGAAPGGSTSAPAAAPTGTQGGSPVIEIQGEPPVKVPATPASSRRGAAHPSSPSTPLAGASIPPLPAKSASKGAPPVAPAAGVSGTVTNLLVIFHIRFQGETAKPKETRTLTNGKLRRTCWVYNDASATLTVAGSKKDYTEQRLWVDKQGYCTFALSEAGGFALPATASLLIKRKGYQDAMVRNISVTSGTITAPDIILTPSR